MSIPPAPTQVSSIQYATGEGWRAITNSPRKNEAAWPKGKWCLVVDVSGGESKIWYCKERYCIRTWNVRSMNPGKLDLVKQEKARLNIDVSGISELKWMRMGEFNSDAHCIYFCGQEFLRRNGVALIVNKRVWNAALGCNLKNNSMISVCFQGKSLNITVIHVCTLTTNVKEAKADHFYEDLQHLLELTLKKDVLCIIGYCNEEVESQEIPGVTDKFGLGVQNEAGQRLTEFCQENALVMANSFPTTQETTLHVDINKWSIPKSDWLCSLQPKMEKLYTVSKSKTWSWLWLRSLVPYYKIQA